ncbi:MAG: peptidylprolyl isomerase [Candidatus Dormibacteria bacterium]
MDRTDVPRRLYDIRLHSVETAIAQGGGTGVHGTNPQVSRRVRISVLEGLIVDAVIAQQAADDGIAPGQAVVDAELAAEARAAGGLNILVAAQQQAGGGLDQLRDEIRSRLTESRLEARFAAGRAAAALAALSAGQAFADVAAQYSDDDGSRPRGGDLGVLTLDQLHAGDPAFAAAVMALQPGQLTPAPVRDRAGYEVLRLDAAGPTTRALHRILVAAPDPYTVKERPSWFAQLVLQRVADLCSQDRIRVFLAGVPQPCASPAAAPGMPGASPTPTSTR